MLVHKRTLGVLEATWDGTYRTFDGARVPVLRPADVDRLGLDRLEWWTVPDGSALALRLRQCYPCFAPVVGEDGELLDVQPWPRWRVYGEPPPPPPPERPKKRRRRRAGLRLG